MVSPELIFFLHTVQRLRLTPPCIIHGFSSFAAFFFFRCCKRLGTFSRGFLFTLGPK